MIWGNAPENDLCFRIIYIRIYPFSPSIQCFAVGNQAIHVFVCVVHVLNYIPSEGEQKNKNVLIIIIIFIVRNY